MISTSIEYLYIPNFYCRMFKLANLLQQTPRLQRLFTSFESLGTEERLPSTVESITMLKFLRVDSKNPLTHVLQNTPNLTCLIIETSGTYIDGHHWEDVIVNNLRMLKVFRLFMLFQFYNDENKDEKANEVLNSFRSSFWLDERKWFVRCHWDSSEITNNVSLYTLPYPSIKFDVSIGKFSKSTCPEDCNRYFYERVYNLHYNLLIDQPSTLSNISFLNIRQLSLTLPFDDQFSSIVPNFDNLITLAVTLTDDENYDLVQSQLQALLDKAPHLYSLRFASWTTSQMPPFKLVSSSIRQLDLLGLGRNRTYRYFDEEQCNRLCQTPLIIQCEILLIKLKTGKNIIDLITKMSNLRALTAQWHDDKWNHRNELVKWLQSVLPASCAIEKGSRFDSEIRLWIK
ncbi:unnamed protein product [Rotaria sp. Silwood2]|nr:unnamed protein product [Rotaria sp. Silwood2]CAF2958045.1 unnamed protein product [Rotaria sp. Silwood2]CAF3983172.1 unnamed protein product [Rotaria sp. Silwood2]CAF4271681.1 unnamed protein product [Rotaria sp. Silwood2]